MAEQQDLGDPAAFMAGVALFDELLREAERHSRSDDSSACLDARLRAGAPLELYALPFVERLLQQPELARGFAGALGDYVEMVQLGLCAGEGAQYTKLTFGDCTGEALAERSRIVARLIGVAGEVRHG